MSMLATNVVIMLVRMAMAVSMVIVRVMIEMRVGVGVIFLRLLRHRSAEFGRWPLERAGRRDQAAPLHPQKPQADQNDQPIADRLDGVDGNIHSRRGRLQCCGRYAYECDRDKRLQ